jgi:hypothetical protein
MDFDADLFEFDSENDYVHLLDFCTLKVVATSLVNSLK